MVIAEVVQHYQLNQITNSPIKFIGLGEKVENFEPFHPEKLHKEF